MTHGERKALMTMCRAQSVPYPGEQTIIAKKTGLASCHPLYTSCHKHLHTFLVKYGELILSPILSSAILDCARAAPMSRAMKLERIDASWYKEIRRMESEPLPSMFNYDVWFDPNSFEEPLHPAIPPNPRIAKYIHQLLTQWRTKVTQSTSYPSRSSKGVSRSTIRDYEMKYGQKWDERSQGIFSQSTIEHFQYHTQIRLGGVVELRQNWYPHGIDPRTYCAPGGIGYNSGKHIQGMSTELVNMLPPTDHQLRLNPTRITLENEDHHLFIWDLESFTSNHHEQKHFIQRLARFCDGWEVQLMDSDEGLITRDLGDLWDEYNQLNLRAEYSMERIGEAFESRVQRHNIAGFLGVYGNLMTCTFVHGASVLMTVDDVDKMNVAGDDGHAASHGRGSDMEVRLWDIVRANGVLNIDKVYRTDEEGAICLKRGIVQMGTRLLQKRMVVYPSISGVLDVLDRFPSHFTDNTEKSRQEKRDSVGSELLRFLTECSNAGDLEPVELEITLAFLERVYQLCSLPDNGSVPQLGGSIMCPRRPRSIIDFSRDPLYDVLSFHYKNQAILPMRLCDMPWNDAEDLHWSYGYKWVGPSRPYLSYMECVGCLVSEPLKHVVLGLDGFSRLVKEFVEPSRQVYEYTVVNLPRSEAFVPDAYLDSYYETRLQMMAHT